MRCPHCNTGITGPGAESLDFCPLCGKDLSQAKSGVDAELVGGCTALLPALLLAALCTPPVGAYLGWNLWLIFVPLFAFFQILLGYSLYAIISAFKKR